ncbi:hypothetical protein EZS27_010619 [termite gut metagenome]|uniref:DUF4302 domain-containing protein n=1 Tax=termite gut metagenome TaxID=433724 RepID=A0A5J4S6V9_9ZZZZ
MRKFIYYFFALTAALLVHSCVQDENNLFEESPAERVNKALSEYDSLLTSAPNGWLLEYYSGDVLIGGYTFLCTFKDGQVSLISDVETNYNLPGTEQTSLYRIISDQGPVLTFDTYNQIFHVFSEPWSDDTDGYEGDYEFVLLKAENDVITLKGKKHGGILIMSKLKESATRYLKRLFTIEEELVGVPRMRIFAGEKEFSAAKGERSLTIGYPAANGEIEMESTAFIYTSTGIKLRQPLTLNGRTVQEFTLDDKGDLIGGADNDVILPHPTPFETMLSKEQWRFVFNISSLPMLNGGDMNDEMFAVIQNIYNEDKRIWNETLLWIYIGANELYPYVDTNPYAIVFYSSGLFTGYITAHGCELKSDLRVTDINQFIIKPTIPGYDFNYYGHFLPLVNYIGENSPYKLEQDIDSDTNTVLLKFTSVNNSRIWFRLRQERYK